ncbi:TetR/AcrR family transcriptional regulator [Nocardioides guangzhouensis]|nr:TetR/AcrR family transcriptional regulator [Nocardioides guangzhouensis]
MSTEHQAPSARQALLKAAVDELNEKGHASVSLRAVARRAGVSHAAPAHFFGDRAGMLTAVAVDGFHSLAVALRNAGSEGDATQGEFKALGLAYLDFGLTNPAVMDLMFRRSELVPDDPALTTAQRDALAPLRAVVAGVVGDDAAEEWAILSWAVAHGLVALVREEALARVAEKDQDGAADLAHRLLGLYAAGVAAGAQAPPSTR